MSKSNHAEDGAAPPRLLRSAFAVCQPRCAAPPLGLGCSACFAKEARPELQLCRRTGGGSATEVRWRGAKPQRKTGRTEHGVARERQPSGPRQAPSQDTLRLNCQSRFLMELSQCARFCLQRAVARGGACRLSQSNFLYRGRQVGYYLQALRWHRVSRLVARAAGGWPAASFVPYYCNRSSAPARRCELAAAAVAHSSRWEHSIFAVRSRNTVGKRVPATTGKLDTSSRRTAARAGRPHPRRRRRRSGLAARPSRTTNGTMPRPARRCSTRTRVRVFADSRKTGGQHGLSPLAHRSYGHTGSALLKVHSNLGVVAASSLLHVGLHHGA